MRNGYLDVLTLIPHQEICTVGFDYLKAELNLTSAEDMAKLNTFFAYFRRTWTGLFNPDHWNISTYIDNQVTIANRTNNPLESYNKHCNSLFTNAHPNIRAFVAIMRTEAEDCFQNYQNVQAGFSEPPNHRDAFIPTEEMIPEKFKAFRAAHHRHIQHDSLPSKVL